jgi:hypothetical protein
MDLRGFLFIISKWRGASWQLSAYYRIMTMEKPSKTIDFLNEATWWIPVKIKLIRGHSTDASLDWSEAQSREFKRVQARRSNVLAEFAHLSSATDEAFLDFARKYGVLGLCSHKRPFTHWRPRFGPRDEVYCAKDARFCMPLRVERLDLWRKFSKKAHSVMRHYEPRMDEDRATALVQKTLVPEDDVELFLPSRMVMKIARSIQKNSSKESKLEVARSWIRDSGLELDIKADTEVEKNIYPSFHDVLGKGSNVRSSLSLRPQCFSLFDVLALELLLTATQADRLRRCSECGMSFVRYRREPEGRRTFCPSCGRRAANRFAQQSWRERNPGSWKRYREEKTHE